MKKRKTTLRLSRLEAVSERAPSSCHLFPAAPGGKKSALVVYVNRKTNPTKKTPPKHVGNLLNPGDPPHPPPIPGVKQLVPARERFDRLCLPSWGATPALSPRTPRAAVWRSGGTVARSREVGWRSKPVLRGAKLKPNNLSKLHDDAIFIW